MMASVNELTRPHDVRHPDRQAFGLGSGHLESFSYSSRTGVSDTAGRNEPLSIPHPMLSVLAGVMQDDLLTSADYDAAR